jgi:hypothetical protein
VPAVCEPARSSGPSRPSFQGLRNTTTAQYQSLSHQSTPRFYTGIAGSADKCQALSPFHDASRRSFERPSPYGEQCAEHPTGFTRPYSMFCRVSRLYRVYSGSLLYRITQPIMRRVPRPGHSSQSNLFLLSSHIRLSGLSYLELLLLPSIWQSAPLV